MDGNDLLKMRNYLDGFQGFARTGSLIIPADEVKRLPDQPCKFAKLSNWNKGSDSAFTAKPAGGLLEGPEDDLTEIYYGFGGEQGGEIAHQLFTGRETDIFPICNLRQIAVRCLPAVSGVVWFSWWE